MQRQQEFKSAPQMILKHLLVIHFEMCNCRLRLLSCHCIHYTECLRRSCSIPCSCHITGYLNMPFLQLSLTVFFHGLCHLTAFRRTPKQICECTRECTHECTHGYTHSTLTQSIVSGIVSPQFNRIFIAGNFFAFANCNFQKRSIDRSIVQSANNESRRRPTSVRVF